MNTDKRLIALLLAATTAMPVHAAGIDVGPTASGEQCAPMICPLRYQQVLSKSFFGAPISITDIRFSNRRTPGSLGTNDFTLILSTARRGVGAVTEDFDGNAGLDAVTFFDGSFAGPSTPEFTLSGNAFAYDPAAGDLLLEFRRNTPQANVQSLYLDASVNFFPGSDIVFTFNPDFFTGVQRSTGLTLGFNTLPGAGGGGSGGGGVVSAVPEPASWAMLIAGFGMAGATLRKRRLAPVATA